MSKRSVSVCCASIYFRLADTGTRRCLSAHATSFSNEHRKSSIRYCLIINARPASMHK